MTTRRKFKYQFRSRCCLSADDLWQFLNNHEVKSEFAEDDPGKHWPMVVFFSECKKKISKAFNAWHEGDEDLDDFDWENVGPCVRELVRTAPLA